MKIFGKKRKREAFNHHDNKKYNQTQSNPAQKKTRFSIALF